MMDPNLQNFHSRLGRIDRTHRAGGGFEAVGTLSRADFAPVKPRRVPMAWGQAIVFVVGALMLAKATMLVRIGDEDYQTRLSLLHAGGTADRIGAALLSADPGTRALAAWLRSF